MRSLNCNYENAKGFFAYLDRVGTISIHNHDNASRGVFSSSKEISSSGAWVYMPLAPGEYLETIHVRVRECFMGRAKSWADDASIVVGKMLSHLGKEGANCLVYHKSATTGSLRTIY
jgi:hypothetical protein